MVDESALPAARHESKDISERVIWMGVPMLILCVVALALLVLALFPGHAVEGPMQPPLAHYPSPELQVRPRADMAEFHAREMRWLDSTGWIDQAHGIAHIPIADAMREVAAEGIAGWPVPSPNTTLSPVRSPDPGGQP
jgi:hypothetical protein